MTLGELREAYAQIMASLIKLRLIGEDAEIEATFDLSDEWAVLVYNDNIYLEFNKNDELFKFRILKGDVRGAMHNCIDASNNEDQA